MSRCSYTCAGFVRGTHQAVTSRQLVLYSKSDFILRKCDLHESYGGCRLMLMTPTTITEICDQCGKAVHLDCDMYKHIRKNEHYLCPSCKNLDPETGRLNKRPQKRGTVGQ